MTWTVTPGATSLTCRWNSSAVPGDEQEGPVVDRDDVPDAQEPGGVGGLVRAHHHLLPMGRRARSAGRAPRSAACRRRPGVPRVVELEAALELDHVPQGLAAVDEAAVVEGYARGVEGMGRGYLDAPDLYACRPSGSASRSLRPVSAGRRRSRSWRPPGAGLPQERHHVREVVEVAVGDEHGVQLADPLQLVRSLGLSVRKGSMMICSPPAVTNLECRVSEVGDPGAA